VKVLIFGCGPAGLLATHAASQIEGAQVIILSRKQPSPLHGCQYLHEPIPGLTTYQHEVEYRLRGSVEEYAQKVYGNVRLPALASPQLYAGVRPAWDLRAVYHQLWERYSDLVVSCDLGPSLISMVLGDFEPDVVLSTIPAPVLCQRGEEHQFTSVRCYAIGDAPSVDQVVPFSCEPFTVICDGTREVGYYRVSNVFGHSTIEWPGHRKRPPIEGVVPFDKPLATSCDCWPRIIRLGRYGSWRKGVLSHHAYSEAYNRLQVISRGALATEPDLSQQTGGPQGGRHRDGATPDSSSGELFNSISPAPAEGSHE
jgi:hypothetical protein